MVAGWHSCGQYVGSAMGERSAKVSGTCLVQCEELHLPCGENWPAAGGQLDSF